MESGHELLKQALDIAKDRGYAEVRLETPELTFSATLAPAKKKKRPQPAASNAEPAEKEPITVKSPLVGYFQAADPAVKLDQLVEPESVVAIIDVFGIKNDVEAGIKGRIVQIHAADGDPLEYGQPLFSIAPEKE